MGLAVSVRFPEASAGTPTRPLIESGVVDAVARTRLGPVLSILQNALDVADPLNRARALASSPVVAAA